jgi:hypothetical protein
VVVGDDELATMKQMVKEAKERTSFVVLDCVLFAQYDVGDTLVQYTV